MEMQSLADAGVDKSLEEELHPSVHFLVDSETQKGRRSVFNFVGNNLTAQVNREKTDRDLEKLKCAAKLNLAFGFILKNIEDGKFRYFYPHQNQNQMEPPKFASNTDDLS